MSAAASTGKKPKVRKGAAKLKLAKPKGAKPKGAKPKATSKPRAAAKLKTAAKLKAAAKPGTTVKAGAPAKPKPRAQYGALPYRLEEGVQVMLITSRETGRWVIPKGWPMKGRSPPQAAAREALEEAGIEGQVDKPLGSYAYTKFRKSGLGVACKVKVFPLRVTAQRDSWPEQGQRRARWFAAKEAAEAVQERQLARLIRRFAKRARPKTPTQSSPG